MNIFIPAEHLHTPSSTSNFIAAALHTRNMFYCYHYPLN
jgi:hypothetical protein